MIGGAPHIDDQGRDGFDIRDIQFVGNPDDRAGAVTPPTQRCFRPHHHLSSKVAEANGSAAPGRVFSFTHKGEIRDA